MTAATEESIPEREGLHAALVLGIWAYLVLLASPVLGSLSLPWQVWANRLGSLALFLTVYGRFSRGKIPPGQMARWTLGLCVWTVASVAFSYVYGASPYIAARIGFLMVVTAVLGLPPGTQVLLLLYGLAVTIYLQLFHPSFSDPSLNLIPSLLCMLFSVQANRARRKIWLTLGQARLQLQQQALVLRENHRQAAGRQAGLDAEVAHATEDLEQTNLRLRQAIDDQIKAFQDNQELAQKTSELLFEQSLGRAAGSAAHDFNNLLGVISATLEVHEVDFCRQSSSRTAYQTIRAEVDRAMVVGRRVLAVSGRQILKTEQVDLRELLPDWVASWKSLAPGLELRMENGLAPVHCDPFQLRQVLEALILNSVEAGPENGEISLRVQAGGRIRVEDQGPGVPEHLRGNLFKPFFTTHSDEQHLGLSLAAMRAVLRQQGGDLTYELMPRAHFCVQLVRL